MSEKTNFTPGPWEIAWDEGLGAKGRVSINADAWGRFARVVVRMHCAERNDPCGEANAYLIAAAPDLYEALRELVDLKAMSDSNGPRAVYEERKPIAWEAARAALSRAHPKVSPQASSETASSRGGDQ